MYYYVDHTSRFERNTGIQRCVRSIATALIGTGEPLRPVVWNREQEVLEAASSLALAHLNCWSGPDARSWAPVDWRQPKSAAFDDWLLIVELVSGPHQPSSQQLRAAADRYGLRLAWVFHDAIPLRLAHLYGASARRTAEFHCAYMAGLAEADLVLANSHTTAAHLCAFLKQKHLASGHLQALPLAEEFSGVHRCPQAEPRSISEPQRFLCVGSLEPRKNHVALLKAIAALDAEDNFPAELVLVGWPNDGRVVDFVQRSLQLNLQLRWEADVDDARLLELYRWCDATVLPSFEEGFGLTVAESLWHRRPCLCSGEGALGELAAAGGCYTLATHHWRSLAAGLQHWLQDPEIRIKVLKRLQHRPLRTWRDYSRELLLRLEVASNNSRCHRLIPSV